MGTIAWTLFFVSDIVAAHAYGAPLEYLAAIRFVGTSIGMLAYVLVRGRDVPERTLSMIEWVVFPAAGVLVSLGAVACGGIASPLAQGVAIITLVRAVIPAPMQRALATSFAVALTFPIVMLLGSLASPPIAAQLRSPAVWTFALSSTFLVSSAILTAAGSRLQWEAKKQVQEARRLGAYRLVARVGSGGMGEVWLARQLPLDREVALKLLRKRVLEEPGAIRRFQREAQSASALSHPNTIRIFDFGASDDGVFYIAMEMLHGLDLEALIVKGGAIPPARAIHLARQICGSLSEAHKAGIIHCDVKPANIFVGKVGDKFDFVKVLDFGLARVTTGPGSSTVIDSIRGTPAFMPPEMVRAEKVGPESDVYALGALLYFMITGKVIFPARTYDEMIAAQLSGTPETPSRRIGRNMPRDLEDVIMKCLAKGRGERFATARDLDEAFAIANSTEYALTGGLFSRSPRALERAERELMCGNVYLNRGVTGAIVERHPFGGFRMSGGGTKAGGKGYLENFLFPRVIAENVLRRGFTPPDEA